MLRLPSAVCNAEPGRPKCRGSCEYALLNSLTRQDHECLMAARLARAREQELAWMGEVYKAGWVSYSVSDLLNDPDVFSHEPKCLKASSVVNMNPLRALAPPRPRLRPRAVSPQPHAVAPLEPQAQRTLASWRADRAGPAERHPRPAYPRRQAASGPAVPSGSWGGRRLRLGGQVMVMGATNAATAAGGRSC